MSKQRKKVEECGCKEICCEICGKLLPVELAVSAIWSGTDRCVYKGHAACFVSANRRLCVIVSPYRWKIQK